MKVAKLVILVSALILGILFVFELIQNNASIIEGRYITSENINPENIRIGLQIIEDEIVINEYRVRLKKDGSFSVKVKEKGPHDILIFLASFISPPLYNPIISNRFKHYPCNLEKGKVVNIGAHYLLEAIEIKSPPDESNYSDLNELYFEWEEIPFANCYNLNISKVLSDYNYELKVYSFLSNFKISYDDLQSLKKHEKVNMRLQPFNTVFQELLPGRYAIKILAFNYNPDSNDLVFVCRSSDKKNTYFNIGMDEK